ncbi:MAG: hypothetical protein ACQERU_07435 [Bacteroidota bacterium]
MKKTIRFLTVTSFVIGAILTVVFMAGAIITSYQSSAEKVKNAQNNARVAKINPDEARQDLSQVQQEALAEYQQYNGESEKKITVHEKKENRAVYEPELAELEQKDSDLKKNLDEYNEGGKDKWETFKTEFSHDMKELGKSLKDLTVTNAK